MKSTRHLIAGAVAAVATAALVWGPTAILAGISFRALERPVVHHPPEGPP